MRIKAVNIQPCAFLTSALDRGGRSVADPSVLSPGDFPVLFVQEIHLWTHEEEYCLSLLKWNLEHFHCRWVCNFWGCGLPFGMCLRCPVESARTAKSYSTRVPGNLVASQNICITTVDQVVISSPTASRYVIENINKPKICISIEQCMCVVGPLLYM